MSVITTERPENVDELKSILTGYLVSSEKQFEQGDVYCIIDLLQITSSDGKALEDYSLVGRIPKQNQVENTGSISNTTVCLPAESTCDEKIEGLLTFGGRVTLVAPLSPQKAGQILEWTRELKNSQTGI